MSDHKDSTQLASSSSDTHSSFGLTNSRTEEIGSYLFKKTREGKWQKRWFETNGCFLTYYKKQGQKLLAALNLPQVGAITLLEEDHEDGPGLFTIALNERVYIIKARTHHDAASWVDALLWRQAGGLVTQKSPAVKKQLASDQFENGQSSEASSTTRPMQVETTTKQHDDVITANLDEVGKDGAPCAACCVII